ncbi:MAG: decaprenyl-phosphate phosphoribosyltransferase [Lachnospiraceae bacterium]|nr:decaprenyl-phosphate phosphoribosyltransferase [Lachnospiraceae bacterium]
MKDIIKLLRPKHYIKNGLVCVSLFFTMNLFNVNLFIRVLLGFVSFSLISSVVYIINDIRDIDADRQHEKKKDRPLASGRVSIKKAIYISIIIFIVAVGIDIFANRSFKSLSLLLIYLVINVFYSCGLKNYPIIDIAILVSGFLLRVLYGATIINSGVSQWVYLTVMSVSFYMGFGKRRNEIVRLGENTSTRNVLKHYNHSFLDKNMYMSMSLAIVFYSLWAVDSDIIIKYHTDKLVLTVPLIIFLSMKYSLNIEKGTFGDPVEVILGDKMLVVMAGIYIIMLIGIIYFPTLFNVF